MTCFLAANMACSSSEESSELEHAMLAARKQVMQRWWLKSIRTVRIDVLCYLQIIERALIQ